MAKSIRKVLVQMLSNAQHLESIELSVYTQMTGSFGIEACEADLVEIEAMARQRLTAHNFVEQDFHMMCVLCAVTQGINHGRIIYVKQVEMKTKSTW